MENDLFNLGMLKKYSTNFKLTPSTHDLLKDYLSKLESGDFKSETKNYLYFYDVILKGILGYKREDVLFDEKEDQGIGKSEFVLQAEGKKFMIIELKGQGIDLDKKQKGRGDNKSPVEQAFGYAINTGDVEWIMVSNYDEFRLYNYHDKTKFISFNALDLLDKDMFSYFMLAFSRYSHVESDMIDKVHKGTLLVDQKLANEFYKLYNETRLMLIKELMETGDLDKLEAIKYSQLILNRYMFICFAEDVDLLPSQISVDTIATPIQKGNIRHGSIWQRLNELFLDINEGNEFKGIPEYNGGLFADNLDFIHIRDLVDNQEIFNDTYQKWNFEVYEKNIDHLLGTVGNRINPIYRNMLMISSFDFSTELDVNILGHIFENSIGDIEELKEDGKGRRKKEGIFYTPDYITDYICRNTIIPYLSKSDNINTVADLLDEYSWSNDIEELDEKLKNIKIVDPACGSGAFLNKATDILLEIHEGVYDIKKGYTTTTDMRIGKGKHRRTETVQHTDLGAYVFDHIEKRREILLNNIYGVDLNEESVEITKLSLFLKVCKKNLKLPNLDKNIRNGNSLISDPTYTNKPFNWEHEFPEIFKEGGFNIVIGNPPYVRVQNLPYEEIDYYKNYFKCAFKRIDISVLFIELANNLLKPNGLISFITSNQFLKSEYGRNTRKFILNNSNIKKIVDYGDLPVFPDAITYVSIFVFGKGKTSNFEYYKIKDLNVNLSDVTPIIIKSEDLNDEPWLLGQAQYLKIFSKMNKFPALTEGTGKCWTGIKTGMDKVFIFDVNDVDNIKIEKEALSPLITAKDCYRYNYSSFSKYLIYPYVYDEGKTVIIPEEKLKTKFPNLYTYLLKNKELTSRRKDSRKSFSDKANWYSLTRFGRIDIFNKEKIIFPGISKNHKFGLDTNGYVYLGASVYAITSENPKISLKYLLSVLNSRLIEIYLHSIAPLKKGGFYSYLATHLDKLPIPQIDVNKQLPFIEKTDEMLRLNKDVLNEVNGFKDWVKKEFDVDKLSKKVEKYYELSEDEFIKELRKKKVDTKSRKNREYLEREFTESLALIKPLLQEIEETDNKINQMVYELYGLTEDDIKIIEESLN